MKSFITLFSILLSLSLYAAEKPNFVLIFIDDMGYGDIGPFGSSVNATPNLDKMAEEGMKLTSFYAAPVCSASRAQLMTGSYAPRVSVPGVFFPAGPNGLNPDEHTVADYLKELGYSTACVGKWHLGDQVEFLPTRHGFDSYFGIPYSNDMQRVSTESGKRVHPVMRDEKVEALIEDEAQRLITRQYTEEVVEIIKSKAADEDPFFIYLPHTAMHVPIFPHEEFVGKSENGRYGDWIQEVDWSVGQVLATLKEQGIDDETLVIFTSDNGPWASRGKDGGVSGPLRGAKGCTLEGGVREPTIVRWPGKIEPGTSSDAIMGTPDILPTFVALAGGKVRPEIKIDGYDFTNVILGEAEKTEREAWFYFGGNNLQAVRQGPWKLALTGQSVGMGFKEKPDDLKTGGRLYNLDVEIGELTNVAEQNPEVVARLEKLAAAMIADIAENKRPSGVVENPVTLYPTVPRAPRKSKKVAASGKPIDWAGLKVGATYHSGSVPSIADKPFTVSCEIEGVDLKGVIASHGGSAIGYSLWAQDGELTFSVRYGNGDAISRLQIPLSKGGATISAGIKKDGSIFLDSGDESAMEKLRGLLKKHPQESFCVGHDEANPVDPTAPKGKFNGSISDVKFTVD